eukprot:Lithocolla_globosa_v1_NODE_313_length_4540_cov_17.716005.p4 type:complete len:144 gc:universal NODE_313_length_4540_cov_17.716005:1249-818(-)
MGWTATPTRLLSLWRAWSGPSTRFRWSAAWSTMASSSIASVCKKRTLNRLCGISTLHSPNVRLPSSLVPSPRLTMLSTVSSSTRTERSRCRNACMESPPSWLTAFPAQGGPTRATGGGLSLQTTSIGMLLALNLIFSVINLVW